jgi:hypothetical protein
MSREKIDLARFRMKLVTDVGKLSLRPYVGLLGDSVLQNLVRVVTASRALVPIAHRLSQPNPHSDWWRVIETKRGRSIWPDLLFQRSFMFSRFIPPHFEISAENCAASFRIYNVNVYDVVRSGTYDRGHARESNNHSTEGRHRRVISNSLTFYMSKAIPLFYPQTSKSVATILLDRGQT